MKRSAKRAPVNEKPQPDGRRRQVSAVVLRYIAYSGLMLCGRSIGRRARSASTSALGHRPYELAKKVFTMLLLFGGSFGNLSNLKHDPELAKALGNMVVVWSHAEQALVHLLGTIGNMPSAMACAAYYRIPTFESRVKVICGMLTEWKTDKHDREHIGKRIKGLNRLSATRNKYAHRTYLIRNLSSETYLCNYRTESGDPDRIEILKANDVQIHVAAVEETANKIWHLVVR